MDIIVGGMIYCCGGKLAAKDVIADDMEIAVDVS
jgi:hypothetical protein